MTWLVGRQQRAENALLAALLGTLALLLLAGAHVHSVFHASGLAPCTSDAARLSTAGAPFGVSIRIASATPRDVCRCRMDARECEG